MQRSRFWISRQNVFVVMILYVGWSFSEGEGGPLPKVGKPCHYYWLMCFHESEEFHNQSIILARSVFASLSSPTADDCCHCCRLNIVVTQAVIKSVNAI